MSVATRMLSKMKRTPTFADDAETRREKRLKVRTVDFDFSNIPLHWIPNDPQTSHTINVLHLLLPEGEAWFCEAFHRVLPRVKDRDLRMQMRGFMGQEAIHSNAHELLHKYLADHNIDIEDYLKVIHWLFHHALADQPFHYPLNDKQQRTWDDFRLAGVSAIEHFTGLLGGWLIAADGLIDSGADENMMNLLLWHASEEVEHQSVAHDVFRHLDGSETLRWAAMGLTLPLLSALWIWGVVYMQRRDTTVKKGARPMEYFRAVREGKLPSLGYIFGSIFPNYFKSSYYPGRGDEDKMEIALEYLRYAPGVTNHDEPATNA